MTSTASREDHTSDSFGPQAAASAGTWPAWRGLDLAIVAAFALIAILFFADRFRGVTPFVFLYGDAADIASFAAAYDRPELYAGDAILGDVAHFKFYSTIHIPLLRWLEDVFGDYGTAFIVLLPLHVFFQLLGFYLLGRVLFGYRYWAVLLALINLALVKINFGTYWGVYGDPQPRFTFQALLPFLLAAAIQWRSSSRRWPWLMVGAGLLMYVHPVSTPAWAFAIWLSLFFSRPEETAFGRHLGYTVALGFLFLLVAAPFLFNYLGNHAHGEVVGAQYETVRALMQEFYGKDFLNIPNGLRRFTLRWLYARMLFWMLAGVGVVGLLLFCKRLRPRLGMVINWGSGIALIAIIVPYVEQIICRILEVIPPEIDLGRGIRYFVPLMLLSCLWPLAVVDEKLARWRFLSLPTRAFGAFLVAIWIYWHPILSREPWGECRRDIPRSCAPEVWQQNLAALDAVRLETPPGSRILPVDLSLELRYYAHRPVIHSFKDRGMLSYTSHAGFLMWNENQERLDGIREMDDLDQRFANWRRFGTDLGAQYLLLYSKDVPMSGGQSGSWREIWSDPRRTLIKLE